jgi:uncharacterized membrane-anchored protein
MNNSASVPLRILFFIFLSAFFADAYAQKKSQNAQGAPPAAAAQPKNELDAAFDAARATMKRGPAEIKLVEQAVLKVPKGFVFVPSLEAGPIMRAMGNRAGDNLLGMVFPESNESWFVVARYVNSGYIKDDDAKDWNAAELLQSLKDGTEEMNKERKAQGIAELEVMGWVEQPRYEQVPHQLVWSVSSKDKGALDSAEKGINYNTYALGREGYVSMNLVTAMKSIDTDKPVAKQLLAALEFNNGKRYSDFNSSTDRVAEYGLAALVGGLAAKKLGLLAIIAAFFVKFAKALVLAAAAVAAVVAKLWKGKKAGGIKS